MIKGELPYKYALYIKRICLKIEIKLRKHEELNKILINWKLIYVINGINLTLLSRNSSASFKNLFRTKVIDTIRIILFYLSYSLSLC